MLNALRFALRQLHKSPGYAIAVILTLALGIGVNTTVFSMVDGFMLRRLPYPELAPALSSMRTDVLDSLRDGGHAAGSSRAQQRLRGVFVIAETALALLLLVGAGLLLRSFARMLETDPDSSRGMY
jgi:hypothetical protein